MSAKPKKPARRPAAESLSAPEPLSETAARLALAAPRAAAPSPQVKERLLARIRAARATETAAPPSPGWRFDSAQAEAGWRAGAFPGVRFKTLSIDEPRDVVMLLIEIAPGARFPDHLHELGGDEGIVISGDVITGGRLMRAGDYYYAAEGTAHTDTVSPSGCTAMVSLTARAWKQWRQQMAMA